MIFAVMENKQEAFLRCGDFLAKNWLESWGYPTVKTAWP